MSCHFDNDQQHDHTSSDHEVEDCTSSRSSSDDEYIYYEPSSDSEYEESDLPRLRVCHGQESDRVSDDLDEDTAPYFGHPTTEIEDEDEIFRLASVNIDNLHLSKDDPSNITLFQSFLAHDIHLLLLQEVGVNWHAINRDHNMYNRLNNFFTPRQIATSSIMSHNTRDQSMQGRQWGGTGIIGRGKLIHYKMGAGSDKAGLGRWTWARYRGKDGVQLRVVSIYRPNPTVQGTVAVYPQQKRFLQESNDDRGPIRAWEEDFESELKSWIRAGDQIVVAGDINQSVIGQSMESLFRRNHLRNLIFEMHGSEGAPKTYYRTREGRVVDGIWGTPNVQASRSGYLEPCAFPGNHSLLFVDISFKSALGHNPPLPAHPKAQRLKPQCPHTTKRYLDVYETEIAKENLHARQITLENSTTPGIKLTRSQARTANIIDTLKTKAMRKAAKKCRKLRMGAVDFSIKISRYVKEIAWWDIAIKRRKGLKVSPRLWLRRKKAAQITSPTRTMSVQDMYSRRKQSRKDYREAKKHHAQLRLDMLEEKYPKALRDKLKREEAARKDGATVRWATGKLSSNSVTMVKDADGNELTDPDEINRLLIRENHAKTQACKHTPFLTQPLVAEFGHRLDPIPIQLVLRGDYSPPPGTDPFAAEILQEMKKPPSIPHQTPFVPRSRISTDDHILSWKRAKANTSAGRSGLTFPMYKVQTQRRHLAELDASQRSLCYTTGFVFDRWKIGRDVQLLKKHNDFRAAKLRTILLLEADFNMNNKVIGQDTFRSGERLGALARDNYGGRNNFRSGEVSMNSRLFFDSIWARRGRAIVMSNDAKGCYDSIAHIVLLLAFLRLDVPAPAVEGMLECIQEMEHFIITAFGESAESYGNDPDEEPAQGVLQGNGAGPAGWAAIATILIKCMRNRGFGYTDWTLIKQRAITITCFAFVDDTDLVHRVDDRSKAFDVVLAEAQQALHSWEGLLRASGGSLAPAKSYWYAIDVIRKDGKWGYATKTANPGDLFLEDGQFLNKRLEVNEAQEALGVMTRPDRNMKDQLKHLKQKASKWCDAIRTKRLKPHEAWKCLTWSIAQTIRYSLIATTFTEAQLASLMAPVLNAILGKCKYQRRLPRKLLYGTLRTKGTGLKNPFHLQTVEHVAAILRHANRDSPSSELHQENMELVQLHIGSELPFWDLPYEEYGPLAPSGWISNTWKSLQHTPLWIQGPDIAPEKLRSMDVSIMDKFVSDGYPPEELIQLNDCRLYLKVTFLSQISNAKGTHISPEAWAGKPLTQELPPPWIHTHKPPSTVWDFWRKCIESSFLRNDHPSHPLVSPLGRWNSNTDNRWIWWIAGSSLYQNTPNGWRKWHRHSRLYSSPKFHSPQAIEISSVPPLKQRASIYQPPTSTLVTVLSQGHVQYTAIPPTPIHISEALAQLPLTSSWSCKHPTLQGSLETLCSSGHLRSLTIVSDGSLKFGVGTSATILVSHCKQSSLRLVNEVPGPIADGDSHRCEVAGLYGAIIALQALFAISNVPSMTCTIACDNDQALRIFEPFFMPNPQQANFDLVNATWSLKRDLPVTWIPEQVKGHQDARVGVEQLTHLEQLNVIVDNLAKAYWQHLVQADSNTLPLPQHRRIHGEGWQVWTHGSKVPSPSIDTMYGIIHDPITVAWWERHHLKPGSSSLIDWAGTADLMESLPQNRRRWITKHASSECGVNSTLVTWNKRTSTACPRCDCEVETTEHVYQCEGHGARVVFCESMLQFKQSLIKAQTHPLLADALYNSVLCWRSNKPLPYLDYPSPIRKAMRAQSFIGWKALMEGSMAVHWTIMQRSYLATLSSRKSSNKWRRTILTQLHHVAWKQWDHRNQVNQNITNPNQQQIEINLKMDITTEFTKGDTTLLPGDRHMLRRGLHSLMRKPFTVQHAWYLNIQAARQRYLRIQSHNDELVYEARHNSAILSWLRERSAVHVPAT